jgi:hypothetical protein
VVDVGDDREVADVRCVGAHASESRRRARRPRGGRRGGPRPSAAA